MSRTYGAPVPAGRSTSASSPPRTKPPRSGVGTNAGPMAMTAASHTSPGQTRRQEASQQQGSKHRRDRPTGDIREDPVDPEPGPRGQASSRRGRRRRDPATNRGHRFGGPKGCRRGPSSGRGRARLRPPSARSGAALPPRAAPRRFRDRDRRAGRPPTPPRRRQRRRARFATTRARQGPSPRQPGRRPRGTRRTTPCA